MSASFRLGKILGIPIGVNYSWFIIFAIVTLSLAGHYFPNNNPGWSPITYWVVGIATSLLFFASVVVHELAHSAVSIAGGTPVKSITLFIFGGIAQIGREAASPLSELLMAVAGPLTSLGLAAFFGVLWVLARFLSEPLEALAGWLALINLSLGLFNMLPGFPLDGGRVLRSLLWWLTGNFRRATRIASLAGQGTAYLLIFGGILIIFRGNWLDGLWVAFIGWFLENAAEGSYRQVLLRDSLAGFTAGDLMSSECLSVPSHLSVGQMVREFILPKSSRCFLVTQEGLLQGIVTLHDIRGVPQSRWETTPISAVMTPLERLKMARLDEEATSLLERMDEADINQMPVVHQGKVVGMVTRDRLLRYIRTRTELRI